ncbi:MAG: alpha/beta hydrolase, partial [Betaproteobacteria bacterium]|nr:alpha/beta hydrolase [Betaproteobacteria bacterium]
LNHPGRIASITLLNTAAKMGDETVSTYAIGEANQGAAIEKYGVAEWCRRTLQYRMDLSKAPPGLDQWVPAEMAKTPTHIAVAAFRLFSTVDLMPRLTEVKAPALLIVGSKCTERRKRHMTEMRDRLQRAKLVELAGYDYGIHFLAPDAVVAEVRKFLKEST